MKKSFFCKYFIRYSENGKVGPVCKNCHYEDWFDITDDLSKLPYRICTQTKIKNFGKSKRDVYKNGNLFHLVKTKKLKQSLVKRQRKNRRVSKQ